MLPIAINVTTLRIALVGNSKSLSRRLALLDKAGATDNVCVYADAPCRSLEVMAGERLKRMWPASDDLKGCALILGADLDEEREKLLAQNAREHNALLNIEDRKMYCDFYYSSMVRRGDLVFGINTNGKSPALSMRMRKALEKLFPKVWGERLEELAQLRVKWKQEGASFGEVLEKSNTKIDDWMKE